VGHGTFHVVDVELQEEVTDHIVIMYAYLFIYIFFYGTFHYLDEKKEVPVLLSGILEGLQLETCDANDVFRLLLTKALLKKPGPETKRLIRSLCMEAKVKSGVDVVKNLREICPPGTTGKIFGYSSSQYVELSD